VIEQFVAVTGSAILNSYWMSLIFKQLYRMIKRASEPPKSDAGQEAIPEQDT
jgi:hypothetical protein